MADNLVLGISDSHDSGIYLLEEDRIIYSVNEERISRVKNISGFPKKSIKNLIEKLKINPSSIKIIGIAGKSRISSIPNNNDLSLNNKNN